MNALMILTQGIVQGVGFRPYVYRLAVDLDLKGHVRNLGNVVEIIIEGENTSQFVERLPKELPPIAKIDSMDVSEIEVKNYADFEIIESGDSYSGVSVIPPDIAICDKCLEEIRNPEDRRYKYPFNACTDCGPRFTVIESVPYDRERTSMEVEAQEMLQESFDSYNLGIKILTVKLQDIVPPAGDVQDAFEDVNKAIQDMNKYINEGKENYNRVIPAAEGEANKIIQEAQGYASERVNTAAGDVARFRSVLEEYEKSPEITAQRLYIETMEKVLAGGQNLTIVDKNLESFLPIMNLTKEGN